MEMLQALEGHNIRTCRSILRSTENEGSQSTSATVYRKLVTVVLPATHMSVKQPRNTEQAKNIRSKLVEKQQAITAEYPFQKLSWDIMGPLPT